MKRLPLLPLLFVSVGALDVDTLIDVLLGLATPAPTRAPTTRPYWTSPTPPPTTRPPVPLTIIATAPPYTPALIQPQPTNEQVTSAPTAPPPVLPPVTPAPAVQALHPYPQLDATTASSSTSSNAYDHAGAGATPTTPPPPTAPLTPPPTPPDSAYQIFPYSGTRPTSTQIHALATSKSCSVLFAACATADLPECDVTGISLRAVIETLLKITMDGEHGLASPDTERFHHMHKWRRNSNLDKAAGVPYGNDSALYAEFKRELPEALEAFSVQVQDDLSIVEKEKNSNDGPGVVHASSGATDDNSGRGATNVTVNVLSSAWSPYALGTRTVVSLAVLVVTVTTMAV